MTRRTFSRTLAGASLAASAASGAPRTVMGVGSASYFRRIGHDRRTQAAQPLSDTLNFIEYCRDLGAGGVQTGLTSTERSYCTKVRDLCESSGMYFEGSGRLPRDESDIDQFKAFVKGVQNAGGEVIRTVLFSGRRYETYETMEAFRQAERQAWKMITLAEPTLRKQRMKIAIENHKNFRSPDLLEIMRKIQSESVGVCVDFGNNYVLMEDPVELAQALAPYAYSSHIKDHLLQEYEDGFLLFDAPLGEGVMDVARVAEVLKAAQPRIRFILETMTRDALKVPYLTKNYWATFEDDDLPGRDLAMTLATVKRTQPKGPLPKISDLPAEKQLALEDENNRKGLAWGAEHLG